MYLERARREKEMGRDIRAGKWVQSHSWEGKEVESQTLTSQRQGLGKPGYGLMEEVMLCSVLIIE